MRYLAEAVSTLVWTAVSVLLVPTILLLLFRRFVPVLGEVVWRAYRDLLIWLVVAPIRLIRLLLREAFSRRGRR